ncbi:MAG: ATP-binding cassette domain-containing protein [Novosphingobium sp.]|nr:ATP-binding cassette domain-containing protein [Novosphingobium sp.]
MSFDVDVSVRRAGRDIAVQFASDARVVALFGASGVGKTSTLEMIAGLLQPDRGHITIAGKTLFDKEAGINLLPEQRACGYVFQDGRLFPHLTVRDNLLYGWKLAPEHRRSLALDVAVGFLGIEHLLHRMPRTLSGGEAQRVAIGRTLLAGPRFLLMDEPLSSLDASRRDGIMRLIERIRDELSIPIIYVSHDRAEVERLAGCVIELD